MSKKQNALVGKLRFPEFKDDWKEKRLGDELKFQAGFPFDAKKFNTDKRGPRLIRNRDLKSNDSVVYYDGAFDESFLVDNGDILIGMDGDFTPVVWQSGNALLNQRVGRVVPKNKDCRYFFHYLLTIQLKAIEDATARTTVKHLSHGAVENITKPIPAFPEQKKIADCLSSLDETITAETEKLEALRVHKKGLMQQLFPAEGETVPNLRFAEFERLGRWEEMSIQKLIDDKFIVSHLDGNHGALYPRAEEFSTEGIPYITANDFLSGVVDFSNCKLLPTQRAMQFKKGVAKDGDILFAHNATVGPVGKLNTSFPFVVLSTTATYFRCDNKKLFNDFLKFALSSPKFISQYTRVMSQSTRNQVPITTQRTFNLQIPKIEEQRRIAECLSSLDELTVSQTEKIEMLKLHKKGLMQQLFPTPLAIPQ